MIDTRRALRGGVLALWSAFFAWLWLSGGMTRYLGPRTYWVIVFGAVALGAAAAGHLLALRGPRPTRPATASDLIGAATLLLPMALALGLPDAQLGAQAASRKASAGGFAAASLLPVPEPGEEISFREIHYASESDDYAASAGIATGTEVDLVGFVAHPPGARGTFSLTRFYVSCCAADAIPYSVPVAANGTEDRPDDEWLRVSGTLVGSPEGWLLEPSQITPVPAPKDPYLY